MAVRFKVITLMLLGTALAAEPISAKNWQQHPQIQAVRAVYQQVQAALPNLKAQVHETEFCKRTLYTNAQGAVRLYRVEGGSDDSIQTRSYYYDQEGKLRFLLVQAGAVNGTNLEVRRYWDATGHKLWEVHKLLGGPGYPFGAIPAILLPKLAFEAPYPCE